VGVFFLFIFLGCFSWLWGGLVARGPAPQREKKESDFFKLLRTPSRRGGPDRKRSAGSSANTLGKRSVWTPPVVIAGNTRTDAKMRPGSFLPRRPFPVNEHNGDCILMSRCHRSNGDHYRNSSVLRIRLPLFIVGQSRPAPTRAGCKFVESRAPDPAISNHPVITG
jgi:hypothetical protein